MPRHGTHIIQPCMTGTGKAHPEDQHPPTVWVPHFDILDAYDYFSEDLSSFKDMNSMKNLWIDGHLAYSLTPEGLETYLCDRLRIQRRGGGYPEVRVHDGKFLVHSSTLQDSSPTRPPCIRDEGGRPFWLIDYVFNLGTSFIIPQELNTLGSPMPLKVRLNLPVFFHNRRGGLGVTVGAAAASAMPGILDEETIFEEIRSITTTHLVLHWPGRLEFTKQTETKVSNTRRPLSVGRFVYHIGLFVRKFLTSPTPIANPQVAASWPVDDGYMNTLYIVGVVHVSAGRWQPILRIGY